MFAKHSNPSSIVLYNTHFIYISKELIIKTLSSLYKTLLRLLLICSLIFAGISLFWVLGYKYFAVPYTPLMAIRYVENSQIKQIAHQWQPLSKISVHLQRAVVSAEDQHFYQHKGFDFQAIKAAFQSNRTGKTLRGGSTISQQTAKNVFLWPQRSWVRKGLETWFTLLIELFWTKQRILEVYLNSIEMGDGIFGAEAAAKFWFNRSAKALNRQQAAAITAILPNPNKYRAHPASRYIKLRKAWIIKQMRNLD